MNYLTRLLLLVGAAAAQAAFAQPYPSRPIQVLVGYAPGASTDILARQISATLEKGLGQAIVIENRPAVAGVIAARDVVRAKPDGYTLLFANVVSPLPLFLAENAVDASKDLAPVSNLAAGGLVLYARANLAVNSFADLVAYAKANPNKLTMGSPAPTMSLIMAVVKQQSGISSHDVPYKGGAAVATALLSGEIDLTMSDVPTLFGLLQAKKVKALFITRRSSIPTLSDVPTSAAVGLDMDVGQYFGYWAPLGTPRDIVRKLSAQAAEAVRSSGLVEQLRKLSMEPIGSTPEEQLRAFTKEVEFWSAATRLTNFKPQ